MRQGTWGAPGHMPKRLRAVAAIVAAACLHAAGGDAHAFKGAGRGKTGALDGPATAAAGMCSAGLLSSLNDRFVTPCPASEGRKATWTA